MVMPTDNDDYKNAVNNAYMVLPDGTKVKWTRLSAATFVEDKDPQVTDGDPVIAAAFPKVEEFSMDITVTNKQMRKMYKFFNASVNHYKRVIRRYHRIVEKCRRSYLKDKPVEYARKQYERSSYYIGHVKALMTPYDKTMENSQLKHRLQ
jgi:hypothetical protein